MHTSYALLGSRGALGSSRPGHCGRPVPIGPPLALAASRGPGLTHSTSPARKWRARGRTEHTLLDGDYGRRPNRPKTFARYHTIPQKVTTVSIYDKGPGHPRRMPRPMPLLTSRAWARKGHSLGGILETDAEFVLL